MNIETMVVPTAENGRFDALMGDLHYLGPAKPTGDFLRQALVCDGEGSDLYADRTSCHKWWANQFRLLLSSLAYILFDHIRRTAFKNTRLARATSATIRNKLIRIGAICLRNTRCVRFHLSSSCPHQDLFAIAAVRLE